MDSLQATIRAALALPAGEAPTAQQIGQAVGMRSRASVYYQLIELEAKCAIVREAGGPHPRDPPECSGAGTRTAAAGCA